MPFYDKFDPEDYYLTEEGFLVFTEQYHLKRGYCCQSNCRHCPYKDKSRQQNYSGNQADEKDKHEGG